RSLMESYDYLDGNRAIDFTLLPEHQTVGFVEAFENRDPRLKQTFMYPGYIKPGQANPYKPNLNLGGYPQTKFVPYSSDQVQWNTNYTDLPLARYGEVLLIFAEAKAELGTLTQADMDKTLNEIRSRVGMPAIQLTDIVISSSLREQYPNVSGAQKNATLTIRKERRVELACEG